MKKWLAVAMVCVSASAVRAEVGPPTDLAAHSRSQVIRTRFRPDSFRRHESHGAPATE